MKKPILFLMVIALAIGAFTLAVSTNPTVFVIGDSTASDYDAGSYPRTGWGTTLSYYLKKSKIKVDNRALSGRSSRSFYSESGAWNKVIADIVAGDYLIIQFGHNDQKEDERFTDPYTTYQEYLKKYIDEAKAKGAIPILATSIHRNNWSGGQIKDSHGDYPPAMRALAQQENVALLDLHKKTEELFESKGQDYTTNQIFLNLQPGVYTNYPNGNSDNTHLQENGAVLIAGLAANAIKEGLASHGELQPLAEAVTDAGYLFTTVNDASYGRVTGAGYNALGDTVILTAIPTSGYAISRWLDGDKELGIDRTLAYLFDTDSVSISAEFAVGYKLTTVRVPGNGGTVSGTGTYVSGRKVTLQANPRDGWYFDKWMQNGEVVSRENPMVFTMGVESQTIEAHFTDTEPVDVLGLYPVRKKVWYAQAFLNFEPEEQIGAVMISDMTGREIIRKNSISGNKLKINLSKGVYVVVYLDKGQFFRSKFIVK